MFSGGRASSLPLISGGQEPTIKELSSKGRKAYNFPILDVPEKDIQIDGLRDDLPNLPEVSEHDLVMHYTRLAHRNFAVDLGFYPLGSCTMKYNPRFADSIASIHSFTESHPATPDYLTQGNMEVLYKTESILLEITGMDRATFQPPAGASGELTGLLMIKAYHEDKGNINKNKIIVPDSAHGTNPASASMAGYEVLEVPTNDNGTVDIEVLKNIVDETVAGLMLTNPNTVGLFETEILQIAEIIHNVDGLLYYDGANLNAIVGISRPGDMGFDIVHSNLHKTFATPHGGGGPGSGPVAVKDFLIDFLPGPIVDNNDNEYNWFQPSKSIGRMHGYHGNFLVILRALVYMLLLGSEGLSLLGRSSVLNSRYLSKLINENIPLAYDEPCMHEFVVSVKDLKKSHNIKAYDIGKALLDHGYHSPTIYFPLIIDEALMFEPTETQTIDTLNDLANSIRLIVNDVISGKIDITESPFNLPVTRPNELIPAKHLTVKWGDFEDLEIDNRIDE